MRSRIITLLLLSASACGQGTVAEADKQASTTDASFALTCSGWIDGTAKFGKETQQLGVETYKTELRWNAAAKALTTTDAEGPMDFCSEGLAEKCNVRVEFGHLVGESTMSGPGANPEIAVRTISYIDVDLATGKAVKKSYILSGKMVDTTNAKTTSEIHQVAQLNCERLKD